ncbi:MAG: hypothetical protein NUV65_06740 [Candidatus Roizmanbacteria bacterium]|nr:hypothetical protein [Candidatus Roizmanbacteria bacterium]
MKIALVGLVLGLTLFAVVPLAHAEADECPAAPSIAAHYLHEQGIKSGSETFKNVVSVISKQMGPQTDFNNVKACDTEQYKRLVIFNVVNSLNYSK